MPWDAIAKRLAAEKETTGACVQQHLTKLRKEMLARGSWVPPLSGKPGNKYSDGDVRGYVMVKKNNESEIREILWTEDAFQYVDLVHINKAKMFETTDSISNGEGTSGSVRRMLKAKGSAANLSEDEMDPADLPSEDEFNPSTKKSKFGGRITRSSAKLGGNSKRKTYDSDADPDADESNSEVDAKQEREPVMMALYQSDEEEVSPGMVTLHVAPHLLARFPGGINQPYTHSHGIQVGNNSTPGEEVDTNSGDGENSEHGGNSGQGQPYSIMNANNPENYADAFGHGQPYSIMDANTAENFAAAFGRGQPYSVMDANTAENYAAAFGRGQQYSVMDANTAENYHDAFGGGVNIGRVPYDGDNPDDSDADDSASDGGQPGNTTTGNARSLSITQSSNPVIRSGRVGRNGNTIGPARRTMDNSRSNRNLMSNQAINRHTGQGNSMGNVQVLDSANSSGQTVYAVNGIGYNPAQTPDARELLMGAFANNALSDHYDGMTFAQIIEEQQALLRANGVNSGSSIVMGDTTSPANNPSVHNRATSNHQIGGTQTETGNNNWVPNIAVNGNGAYQGNVDVPMNGYEMDGGNDESITPEPDDDQHPNQGVMDGYEVIGKLLLYEGCLLIKSRTSMAMLLASCHLAIIE
jgi:hypothetical protein